MDNKNEPTNLDEKVQINHNEELEDNINSQQENIVIEDDIQKPISKNEKAKELVENSVEIISKVDNEIESIKENVKKDISRFEEIKNNILNSSFVQSQILLNKASYDYEQTDMGEPVYITLDTPKEEIKIKNISTGGFTGFILSLIAMAGTTAGWVYVASKQVGVKIDPNNLKVPDEASINKMLEWIGGGMTGGQGNTLFGMATVGVSSLLVGYGVYKLYVMYREHKNFKIAQEIYEKSNLYAKKQEETKTEIQKIDEHVQQLVPLLENLKVLLDEQNGKLQRIIHVEGELEDSNNYHPTSIEEMQKTDRLMEQIEALMNTPVTTKDGKLNPEAVEALEEAKRVYNYYISKIYS